MGWLARRESAGGDTALRIRGLVPGFILGFLVMAALRTLGDATLATTGAAFALLPGTSWQNLTTILGSSFAGWLLTAAMASVGLSTNLGMFRQLGLRPLWVGAVVSVGVGALGMGLAILVSPLIRL
jgi:uncharacterized membrane protein YadS